LNAWLNGLASGDQRRPTGTGSVFDVLRDDALYKSTVYFILLLPPPRRRLMRSGLSVVCLST